MNHLEKTAREMTAAAQAAQDAQEALRKARIELEARMEAFCKSISAAFITSTERQVYYDLYSEADKVLHSIVNFGGLESDRND